jgi:transposase
VAIALPGGGPVSDVETLPNDPSRIKRWFQRVLKKGPVKACYEAGPCGYTLQRSLTKWGVHCDVIAPTLIPRKPGDRRKTDRRDAIKLATCYRDGSLTPIVVPDEERERHRSVVRSRTVFQREIHRSKQHILKLLQTRGHRWDHTYWTQDFLAWLRALALDPTDRLIIDSHLELIGMKQILRERMDEEIQKIAELVPYARNVARLRCLKGIDTLSAVALVCEIGDVRRFENPRRLMGYMGLTVTEYSSGETERRGGITKCGNSWCRRLLVESAWSYQHKPRISKRLKECWATQPLPVVGYAERAQQRLHTRYWKLVHRRMPPAKANVAVARELVGFVWALLQEDDRHLEPRVS